LLSREDSGKQNHQVHRTYGRADVGGNAGFQALTLDDPHLPAEQFSAKNGRAKRLLEEL
jgi:hypothetical protein